MKFLEHVDKIERLTLYKTDSSLCSNLFYAAQDGNI